MPAIAPASKMHAHSCRESQGCRCAGTLHHHIQNTEGAGRASVLRLLASPLPALRNALSSSPRTPSEKLGMLAAAHCWSCLASSRSGVDWIWRRLHIDSPGPKAHKGPQGPPGTNEASKIGQEDCGEGGRGKGEGRRWKDGVGKGRDDSSEPCLH